MTTDNHELPYQPYSGHSHCPKCAGELDSRYMEAGTTHLSGTTVMFAPGHPEWMLRECFDCGFTRPEMCMDAYPETALMEGREGA
jgi:hypothetical protein